MREKAHPEIPPERRYRRLVKAMPAIRGLLDLPGRIADRFGRAHVPSGACAVPDRLAEEVRASRRANAYLSLEKGLLLFQHGEGFVTFHASGRNAFAVGGVHGPPGSETATLTAFRERMNDSGFSRVLVFPVAAAEIDDARAAGFATVATGSEPFVDPTQFDLRGRRKADLRQMVNRVNRRWPLTVIETNPALDGRGMHLVYRDWLARRPTGHQMRLLIGTPAWDLPYDRRYFLARRPGEDTTAAFITITPGYGGAAWGLDVMARHADAPAGAMEFLIVETIRVLAEEGVRRFSLGACPMYEAGDPGGWRGSYMRSAFRFLYRSAAGNSLFHFRSLAYFKRKFAPWWEPVHVAAWPNAGPWAMYVGCRMWGLFGDPK